MPRLFAKTHYLHEKINDSCDDNLTTLNNKITAFRKYHDNLALEFKKYFKDVSECYEQQAIFLTKQRREGFFMGREQDFFDKINAAFTCWNESSLRALVYDYDPQQKQYDAYDAFELGEKATKYKKILAYFQDAKNWEKETVETKAAIEKLRETVLKFEQSKQHPLYFYAYNNHTKGTYSPPQLFSEVSEKSNDESNDESKMVMRLH